jgi:adenylate cyclase
MGGPATSGNDPTSRGMASSPPRPRNRPSGLLVRAYQRLGARYPSLAVAAIPQLAYVNVVLGVALIAFFVHFSTGDYVRVVLVGLGLMFVYNMVYVRVALRHLRPLRPWLEGKRGRENTVVAWSTCASFPGEMMRREWLSLLLGGLSYGLLLLWAAYATWQFDLAAYTVIPLFAGIAVWVVYIQALRFFILERVLRPVLDDIARQATDEVDLYAPGLPLRTRLLAALPAINVVTGVFTVGITGAGHDLELSDLGLAVVVSVAIAGTVSLALTLLLSDSVTAPIDALHEATQAVGRGDFGARVPVVTTDETGALARSFNQMAAGLEQREQLREAFGTFVDPDLTERVLEEGTDLAGDEVEVSLLFMDIRGFTTYSEQAEAREVVARLNDLYGEVVPVILRHAGHANKFIGDGLLAVFGAPNRLPDHADRAVAAGLEIAQLVRERYRGELRLGIGVNSGRVVVGTIGGGGRLDFTVIGDAVNTAARVESATRQTDDDMLITGTTRRLLSKDETDWEERPGVTLKGKTQMVPLYGPRAVVDSRAPANTEASGLPNGP